VTYDRETKAVGQGEEREAQTEKNRNHRMALVVRWLIFTFGLIVMAFGIVLMIKAELGSAPWDVFHIGLTLQFGLTIGTWSIIVGVLIIALTSVLTKSWPPLGALINMFLVGVFIDLFMFVLAWYEPTLLITRFVMLVMGILIIGLGIGIYIAPNCGAGPRDSLMLALTQMTGWKVQYVRALMEILVLLAGWLLGGPVFIGTLLFCFGIGSIVGLTLPVCQRIVQRMLDQLVTQRSNKSKLPGTSIPS
jgi:uncharacterized membrane protein YczE